MRSSAVRSKYENALSVVAAVHTYGAFLLVRLAPPEDRWLMRSTAPA